MSIDLNQLTEHEMTDDCAVCNAQDIVHMALIPAVAAWEQYNGLPRFALALQGAATMLGAIIEHGVAREDLEATLGEMLDDIEMRIAEDKAMGGPPQGSA